MGEKQKRRDSLRSVALELAKLDEAHKALLLVGSVDLRKALNRGSIAVSGARVYLVRTERTPR